jgi:hypothetical protein
MVAAVAHTSRCASRDGPPHRSARERLRGVDVQLLLCGAWRLPLLDDEQVGAGAHQIGQLSMTEQARRNPAAAW